jgi:hypothetical protein
MSLTYKSCIFCDLIFDTSNPHICETATNKIDNDNTIKLDAQENTNMNKFTPPSFKDNDNLPSQKELYNIVLQLSKKCESLQSDVNNLKAQYSRRLKRDIAEYLEYDQRPKYTFLEWVTSFVITDEILITIFEIDLFEGIKKCINDRIQSEGVFSVPIRVFKDKPDYIFVYTDEPIDTIESTSEDNTDKIKCTPVKIRLGADHKDLLKLPIWRMVPKTDFMRIKEYISEHILKKFYIWEKENEPKMKHSSEKMDILTNYTLKIIGHSSKQKKNTQNTELYKWFFSKMAVS